MNRFEDIYRENFAFVWSAARRCGVPVEAADDVVQDVFMVAHRRSSELDWGVPAHGWLYRVTRNVAMRYRRGAARRGRREAVAALSTAVAVEPHPRLEAARTLETLLEQLTDPQREVFEMSEVLGMSGPEIASALGVPANTVYSRLRLARSQLKAQAQTVDRIREGVVSTRDAYRPTPSDQKRTLAALLPMLHVPRWSSIPASLSGLLKPVLVVGLGASIATVVATRGEPPESTPLRAGLVSPIPAQGSRRPKNSPVRIAPVAPGPVVEPDSTPPPPRRPPTRTRSVDPNPAEPVSTLAEELALLDEARALLRRKDASAALRALDRYDARFPNGQLRAASRRTRCEAEHPDAPAQECRPAEPAAADEH